jgi:hypothetical protein
MPVEVIDASEKLLQLKVQARRACTKRLHSWRPRTLNFWTKVHSKTGSFSLTFSSMPMKVAFRKVT